MKLFRIFIIILSIFGLSSCASGNKYKKITATKEYKIGVEAFMHIPDQDLVNYFRAFEEFEKINNSKTSTAQEKSEAEFVMEAIIFETLAKVDENIKYTYTEEDNYMVLIELVNAYQKSNNNNIALIEAFDKAGYSVHKSAKIIRVFISNPDFFLNIMEESKGAKS